MSCTTGKYDNQVIVEQWTPKDGGNYKLECASVKFYNDSSAVIEVGRIPLQPKGIVCLDEQVDGCYNGAMQIKVRSGEVASGESLVIQKVVKTIKDPKPSNC